MVAFGSICYSLDLVSKCVFTCPRSTPCISQACICVSVAKIEKIFTNYPWFYEACIDCKSKVHFVDGVVTCLNCKVASLLTVTRYACLIIHCHCGSFRVIYSV